LKYPLYFVEWNYQALDEIFSGGLLSMNEMKRYPIGTIQNDGGETSAPFAWDAAFHF